MFTHLFARCRFGSALRTFALALLLSGAVAPATFADRTTNQLRRGDSQSTDTASVACGTGTESSGSSVQPQRLVADPASGSDTDAPEDTVPAHPLTGHPW